MVRLAMVGCGQISERFFQQAAQRPDVEFVATCARTLVSARSRADQYGVPDAYDSFERMYDEVKPDGVVVTTPHSVHAAPTIAALRRGIHVLNEKPMATTLSDCRDMVEAARAGGAILMNLPLDHSPAFLTLLEHFTEGWIGKWTGAESVLMIPGPPRDNWYYDRSVAQGGAMLDCLVYPLSRLISLLGPASLVSAHVNTLIPHRIVGGGKRVESDVDDNVTLIVEWSTGQQAVVRTLWGSSFTRNDTSIYGRRGTLWLSGGQVILHAPDGGPDGAVATEWQGLKDCWRIPIPDSTPNESHIDHFVECIHSGAAPRCSGELQLHVHEILFEAYTSAVLGERRTLQTTFTPWTNVDPDLYDTRSSFI